MGFVDSPRSHTLQPAALETTPRNKGFKALAAATVVASAFLLFAVQPMAGRLLLPYFGGSASVWSVCMLFFQALLLLGYLYADLTSRKLAPHVQTRVHFVVLAAALATLPIALRGPLESSLVPAARVPLVLLACVGVPYFALSTTGPLVQVWYVRRTGKTPYRIYALSNVASLAALLAYPFAAEPLLTLQTQTLAWSAMFGAFALLCGRLAWSARDAQRVAPSPAATTEPRAGILRRIGWVVLAAFPSALLLATTNHLSQNVAAIPFLWVLPLAAYLLSLILCFDTTSPGFRRVFSWILPVALAGMAYAMVYGTFSMDLRLKVALFTGGLFCAGMVFHGELVERKPGPADLTIFYLMVSLGGVVGGAVVALLAPVVLPGVYELPILLAASSVFLMLLYYRRRWYIDALWAAASVATLVYGGAQILNSFAGVRVVTRNFYGALRVVETGAIRQMVHGTVMHGAEPLDPARRGQPTLYYAPGSGAYHALVSLRRGPQMAGIVGLGIGTVAAYAQPEDHYIFYELDPSVIRLARSEFTYLNRPNVETIEGDGRLALRRETRPLDVLLIDAFSGDAIPTHLLTSEAVDLYLSRLKYDGVLGFHISNSVLDLEGVVAKLADAKGLAARIVHIAPDEAQVRNESIWVLMARSADRLEHPELRSIPEYDRAQSLWTDDFTNLFACLRVLQ